MSDQLTLSAEPRERAGKGASRHLRRTGRVPAVIYGGNEQPLPVHVEEKELTRQLNTGHFMNSTVVLHVAGAEALTLPKDVAFDPVSDRPIHVDFLRIAENAEVEVAVPVLFVGEDDSQGLERGGVLNVVRHELELICEANRIPDQIEVSVAGLDVGDSLHISAVQLPEGSRSAITDRDFTIATIVAPSALRSSEGEVQTQTTEEGPAPEA